MSDDQKRPRVLGYLPSKLAKAAHAAYEMEKAQGQIYEALGRSVADLEQMARKLAATGVSIEDIRTPRLAQAALDARPGAPIYWPPTPGEGQSDPEMTHSGEQSQVAELKPTREATPLERREAWLKLVAKLEGWLLETEQRELAAVPFLATLEGATHQHGYLGLELPDRTVERAQAKAWAARQVVELVRRWRAPEVPRDDETGQGSILELFPGADSTAVENPVEDLDAHLADQHYQESQRGEDDRG